MKRVFFVLLVMVTLGLQAQNRPNTNRKNGNFDKEMANLSPEQRAELKTQRMVLHLDLTEDQQKKVQELHKEREAKLDKMRLTQEQREALTEAERYAHKKARLDDEIEFKRALKELLTEEQYARFQDSRENSGGKRKSKGNPRN